MVCHACWLNDLMKVPCLQSHDCRYEVNLPSKVTMRCYVTMTQSWSQPGGQFLLISHVDKIPFGHIGGSISSRKKPDALAMHLQPMTSDLGELQEMVDLALEILPRESPWIPFVEMPRLIVLSRSTTIEHAPPMLDDGRGIRAYEKDLQQFEQFGPAHEVSTWDEWFRLREEKEREHHGNRKKSDRGA